MTDIVERLRAGKIGPRDQLEAAAEIERLTNAEECLRDDLTVARDENERLRAALREIINLGGAYGIGLLPYADRIARAALAEEKHDDC